MARPFFDASAASLKEHVELSPEQQQLRRAKNIRFGTTIGLAIALLLGFAVILMHGGHSTVTMAAYGAALGTGGVLGFLFGVPSAPRGSITKVNANKVAIGGPGDHSQAIGRNVEAASPASSPAPAAAPASNSDPNPKPDNVPAEPAPPATQDAPSGIVTVPSTSHTTSNLEQVADWVTKLLLGGGLTQMQRIPPTVWRWSRLVAYGIIGDDRSATEQLIVAQQSFAAGTLVYGFILGFFAGFLITKLQLGTAISD